MRYTFPKKKKIPKKKKGFQVEQQDNEPSIKLMDIIQDILDIENKVIDVKVKLKKLTPKVKQPSGRKLDNDFFTDREDTRKEGGYKSWKM